METGIAQRVPVHWPPRAAFIPASRAEAAANRTACLWSAAGVGSNTRWPPDLRSGQFSPRDNIRACDGPPSICGGSHLASSAQRVDRRTFRPALGQTISMK